MSARLEQPRVPPEALSWCISAYSQKAWRDSGRVLQKAHRVDVVGPDPWGRMIHKPACGAWMEHVADNCAGSLAEWPACRHCAKKLTPEGAIPKVYFE